MNVFIENYRGHDIIFGTDEERFSFEADSGHWGERQTYAACKKGIDDYLKINNGFKPFKIVYSHGGEPIDVVGIRKDMRFMIQKKGGKPEQLSEYDERNYDVLEEKNAAYYREMVKHDIESDVIKNERAVQRSLIKNKISARSLKDYKTDNFKPA